MVPNGEASNSKSKLTSIHDVLKGLVDWLCSQVRTCEMSFGVLSLCMYCAMKAVFMSSKRYVLQLRSPTHPNCSIPTATHCLATLLKETYVRTLFVQADGVKLLIPLISPASTQQSIQVIAAALNYIQLCLLCVKNTS
jgi:V-type H+-transporting ATPase subunit H